MLVFQVENREYHGASAVEVVRALKSDSTDYPVSTDSVRHFLLWSLSRLGDRVHPREMDVSDSLEDETLALGYLYLRDEYGAGKLISHT
ncbi:MAG: hypothetical protein ABJA02_15555 [Acidobacteriota bacterium]